MTFAVGDAVTQITIDRKTFDREVSMVAPDGRFKLVGGIRWIEPPKDRSGKTVDGYGSIIVLASSWLACKAKTG